MAHSNAPSLVDDSDIVAQAVQALRARGVDARDLARIPDDAAFADEVALLLKSREGGRFAIEQVETHYAYPADYGVLSPQEQIDRLKSCFPDLETATALAFARDSLPGLRLPAGAEGWFAVPRWRRLASSQERALTLMLSALAGTRDLYVYPVANPDDRRLRNEAEGNAGWERLCAAQEGDILLVPAQFGLAHAGRSIRRARELYGNGEFGLGAFAVAAMLLTHSLRLTSYYSLFVQCPGDEYADTDGEFIQAPAFGFSYGGEGKLLFFPRWTVATHEEYGSATAFLPDN